MPGGSDIPNALCIVRQFAGNMGNVVSAYTVTAALRNNIMQTRAQLHTHVQPTHARCTPNFNIQTSRRLRQLTGSDAVNALC